jgi:hypothetical protein
MSARWELIIGTVLAAFFNTDSRCQLPTGDKLMIDNVILSPAMMRATEPVFFFNQAGVYDLTIPVMAGQDRAGYVRVGVSSQRYA